MKNLSHPFIKTLVTVFIWFSAADFAAAQQNKVISKYENQKELTANTSITFTDGFTITAGTEFRAYISTGPGIPVNTVLNPLLNTIVSYSTRVAGIIDPSDPQNGVNQVNTEVQTLDHFGRVLETQSIKATPDLRDLIVRSEYDNDGREPKKFEPYAYPTGRKNFYGGGSTADIYDYYYQAHIPKTPSIASNRYPWTETIYDNSPLNRVLETGGGDGTYIGSGHTLRTALLMGSSDVAKYTVSINSSTGSRKLLRAGNNAVYYPLEVAISSVKDQNVTDMNGTVYEFKDKDDQVILKRQFNKVGATTETLSTYYVYDDLGNLSFVLPPKAGPDVNAAISQSTLDNLCYQYRYDGLNRMIAKKVPGKGREFMVYNKLDQVVMSQDSVQRMKVPQEWNISKYDALGRVVITGIFSHTGSSAGTNYLSTMQGNVDGQAGQWESRTSTGNGYTTNSYPISWATTLSINYYDDYSFPGGNPYPYSGTEVSSMTRGQLTGSRVNVLGTSNMMWRVNYYDDEGRQVKTFSQHYKGGTLLATNYDEVSSSYDFSGSVLSVLRSHKVSGTEQLKVLNEYSYDHRGRKTGTWQTINTGPRVLLSQMEYDDLGNVYKKKLHSTNGGSTFLQTITYAYNNRGLLLRAAAPLLDIKLEYNISEHGSIPQYNGNISMMEYTGTRSGNRWFTYSYDNLDRLTGSAYSTASELNEAVSYDKNGNITSLKRGPSSNTAISYSYAGSGMSNQLAGVSGARTGSFTYDGNGSARTDGTRSITSISYNQLNLPSTVTGSQTAAYTYDAAGTKLKSVQGPITREYINGIQYRNGVLDFIATDEGRAVRKPSDGSYHYEYDLKDHLGNTRVSITDVAGVATVTQEDEYYAFGLERSKFVSGDKNNYLYNGKELQETLTDEYDYGARFYDPVIGRWNSIDPLSENYQSVSPYNYADYNPINNIDPNGQYVLYGADAQAFFGVLKQQPYKPPQKTEEEKAKEKQEAYNSWMESLRSLNKWMINFMEFKGVAEGIADLLPGNLFKTGTKVATKTGINLIPEGKLANHLFKGAGKLADNAANRTLIQKLANGKALGVDAYGKSWYMGLDGAGKSIYTYTQNGVVKGAGYATMSAEQMILKYGLK